MNGWHVLNLLTEMPGARLTILLFALGIACNPRGFGLVLAIVVFIHMLIY